MTWAVIALALALLGWIAVNDLRHYQIPNWSVIALAGLFVLHALAAGAPQAVLWHGLLAVAIFAALLVPFHFNWMGGGDVKILGAAFLWTGLGCAFSFAVLLCVAAMVHVGLARLGVVGARGEGRSRRIPFGPAAAVALGLTLVLCVPNLPAWAGAIP